MKWYDRFICALFCLFFGLGGVLLFALPHRDFSPEENRVLAQAPVFSARALLSGVYMQEAERFLADQFPFRDGWVAAKAYAERFSGRRENNGVYFCAGDTLIPRFEAPDESRVEKNYALVDTFAQSTGVPVYLALIPGKASVWADRLPKGAPGADEFTYLQQGMRSAAQFVPAYTVLMEHRSEEIYYRTDHHWTGLGAYYAYTALAQTMGFDPVALSAYDATVVADDFYGTAYSTSGVRWVRPDSILRYVPDDGITVTGYDPTEPVPGALYLPDRLEGKDKYQYFLGGVQPRCVITTPHIDAPKLLLVRDSYADGMAPFLTAHFSEIHLIDPRYYRASLAQYIQDNDIDAAVVMYSMANFTTDGNLFVLGL